MNASLEEVPSAVEPLFLTEARNTAVDVRVGLMNRIEHHGVISDIGRYEINLRENGKLVTLLKQEISFITAPHRLLPDSDTDASGTSPDATHPGKPNIQQEFLDKAIREHHLLTLFLLNGQRFKANIAAYDNFTLLLRDGEKQHLYYKHSITTINR